MSTDGRKPTRAKSLRLLSVFATAAANVYDEDIRIHLRDYPRPAGKPAIGVELEDSVHPPLERQGPGGA